MKRLFMILMGFAILGSCTYGNSGKKKVYCISSTEDTVAVYETYEKVYIIPDLPIIRTNVFKTTSGEYVCCETENGKVIVESE